MKKSLRALVAAPLISATLLAGALVPQAAHATKIDDNFAWNGATSYTEFGLGYVLLGSGGSMLVFQGDGNLVFYNATGRALWQSQTYGRNASKISFQNDGNIVIYRADNTALWSAGVSRPGALGMWQISFDVPGSPTPVISEHNTNSGSKGYWRIP